VKLSAWFYAGGDERAPAVIMAHRMGGTNEEWKPLLERLFPVNQKMNVLTMDMRGHGESSKKQGDNKKTSWTVFDQKDFVAMAKDVEAAIGWFNKRPAGAPSSIILVGSDIGATSSVIAAGSAGKQLAAVAIISPGAALRGVDLYKPFGAITGLPNLVIGGQKDNVAEEPLRALPAMSKTTQVHTYDSSMHGAEYLGNDKPESWDDVADWIDARARAVGVTPAASASSETSIPKPEASAQ
jgi:pimeloyl-ACP methyl ester carboxylesterase